VNHVMHMQENLRNRFDASPIIRDYEPTEKASGAPVSQRTQVYHRHHCASS
jgi:hypothetical protein